MDVDECASSPCLNGAVCRDSMDMPATICVASPWDCATQAIVPLDSRSVCGQLGLLECRPAVPMDAYRCSCAAGFTDGLCAYDGIPEYDAACSVLDSQDVSGALEGRCGVDVDECASSPCLN
eukprot:COSAG01_NODE_44493_length_418_cov_2.153605_1_plen_121_part_01